MQNDGQNNIDRRTFLSWMGALAATPAINAVPGASFAAATPAIDAMTAGAAPLRAIPIGRYFGTMPMVSVGTCYRFALENAFIENKEQILKLPPGLTRLSGDPADIFFGGAAEIFKVEYPHDFIDYESSLRQCFSRAIHFVTFKKREHVIIADYEATQQDMDLLEEWVCDPSVIRRIAGEQDIEFSLRPRSPEKIRHVEAAQRAVERWLGSMPEDVRHYITTGYPFKPLRPVYQVSA